MSRNSNSSMSARIIRFVNLTITSSCTGIARCLRMPRLVRSLLVITVAAIVGGCGQGRRHAVDMLPIDPSVAAEKAVELYDKNGDGSIDELELAAAPGIYAARDRYDADGNHQITKEEIAAHLTSLYASSTPWVSVSCQVYQGGRPLSGATLRFAPEPFLKDLIKPASGVTDDHGYAIPAVTDEDLPADKRGLRIIQPGPYRVQIEHPNVKQSAASLGCEVNPTSRGGTQLVFRL
jgi:hypothetical protein